MGLPIAFHFDERKAAQAAAWLLRRHGRPLDAARLATLLYLVDRRAVLESGGPTTGDAWIATEHGPSLRRIAELLDAGSRCKSVWSRYVQPAGRGAVAAADADDCGALSDYDRRLLDETRERFADADESLLRGCSAEGWGEPGAAAAEIDPRAVLLAAGLTEQHVDDIAIQAEAVRSFQATFAR